MRSVDVVCALVFTCVGAVQADAQAGPANASSGLLSFGLGGTDVLSPSSRAAAEVRLDYRSNLSLLPILQSYVQLKPWVGIETSSRQSVWGGGGVWLDIPLGRHWVLSPNVGVGGYGQGNGKNLGSVIEFRSSFEGGYVFENGSRLVASFSHTSNAGLTRRNPGTEAATISYQIPLSVLAGH